MTAKRALVIGIDWYPDDNSLQGCVNDATGLTALLSTNDDGSPNWKVTLVTAGEDGSIEITRDSLREAIESLFSNSRDADLLFYFSGHGGQSSWGAELMTQDFTRYSMGVSMNDIITLANDSPARSITLLLDCCFSGDAGNPSGLQQSAVSESFRIPRSLIRENVTIIAASRGTEPSMEVDGEGAFTRLLLDGLAGGATDHRGNVTALGLYGYISPAFDAWEQRPVFKANLTEPVVLRRGPAWLEPELLRSLPEHFPTADFRLQLTPAHEGDGRPLGVGEGTPEQRVFDYLGRLRNANLVTTDNRKDHYWAAMESDYVYLTQLGKYFWRLANRNIL